MRLFCKNAGDKMIQRFLLLIVLFFCFSCSEVATKKIPSSNRLHSFMSETFENLTSASITISSKKLIKNLSHLNKMNYGGSHYYPLEREAITEIITSLSSSEFSECILMNSEGKIIYTMKDDEILGKTFASFASSPLPPLFNTAITGEQSIYDFSVFPSNSTEASVFFAVPVKENDKVIGVLIAAVSSEKIINSVSDLVMITDARNIVRYHIKHSNFMKNVSETEESSYPRKIFEFKEIHWNLITK